MKKHIPNCITLLNLLCGSLAIIFTLKFNEPLIAVGLIALAALFDLLDGMFARWLHATSSIGADLDSLSDVVSFGLAPALLVFTLLTRQTSWFFLDLLHPFIIAFVALLLPLFAALRLAKFNNDTRQHYYFFGLPVPGNALFWCGYTVYYLENSSGGAELTVVLVVAFSLLMISEVRMLSVKMFGTKEINQRYKKQSMIGWVIVVGGSLIACLLWGILGISFAVVLYVLVSLVTHILNGSQLRQDEGLNK